MALRFRMRLAMYIVQYYIISHACHAPLQRKSQSIDILFEFLEHFKIGLNIEHLIKCCYWNLFRIRSSIVIIMATIWPFGAKNDALQRIVWSAKHKCVIESNRKNIETFPKERSIKWAVEMVQAKMLIAKCGDTALS